MVQRLWTFRQVTSYSKKKTDPRLATDGDIHIWPEQSDEYHVSTPPSLWRQSYMFIQKMTTQHKKNSKKIVKKDQINVLYMHFNTIFKPIS